MFVSFCHIDIYIVVKSSRKSKGNVQFSHTFCKIVFVEFYVSFKTELISKKCSITSQMSRVCIFLFHSLHLDWKPSCSPTSLCLPLSKNHWSSSHTTSKPYYPSPPKPISFSYQSFWVESIPSRVNK